MTDPVRVEQTKLLASALNTVATSCVTVGIATPLAGYIYNVSNFRTLVEPWVLLIGTTVWLSIAVSLHLGARRVLRGLAG
ncbi:hypothetical protein MKK69_08100 [Methylobacterium sp. J-026]|uniref:hypothetical protein n=1 Tax=Methylobacterium sp. J-026 TaxID=2836624 RepID=UPI001FBB0E40|nr:hypothetical protein [Methylobacterium sp. J-026]MCJ2134027.1 hypothetical protein [Methylobacterium sp. J-026]